MRWFGIILLLAALAASTGTGLVVPLNGCGTDPNGLPKPCS